MISQRDPVIFGFMVASPEGLKSTEYGIVIIIGRGWICYRGTKALSRIALSVCTRTLLHYRESHDLYSYNSSVVVIIRTPD